MVAGKKNYKIKNKNVILKTFLQTSDSILPKDIMNLKQY